MTVETEVAALTTAVNSLTSNVNVSKATLDASVAAAEAAFDSFDDRYLGVKALAPENDNDGNALLTGALYFNSANNTMNVYTGSAWAPVANNNIINPNVALTQDLATNGNDVKFGDNDKATFGAGDDLQIYHDASDSYIKDEGTGNLYLTTNGSTMNLQAGSDNMVKIYKDAQVEIFHDASVKLATTSTGIDVTGEITADGLTVNTIVQDFSQSGGVLFGYNNQYGMQLKQYSTPTGVPHASIVAPDDNNGWLSIEVGGSQTEAARFASNGDISFYEDTGTTPKFHWSSSAEKLGIGTSSPSAALTVNHALPSGNAIAEFRSTGNVDSTIDLRADGTGDPKILFDLNGASSFALGVDNSDSNKFKISGGYQLGTNDRFVIDSSGRVGIGTSAPDAPLTVKGETLVQEAGSDGNAAIRVQYGDDGNTALRDRARLMSVGYSGVLELLNSANVLTTKVSSNGDSYFNGGNLLVGTTSSAMNAGGVRLKNGGGNLGEIALSNNSGSADYVARFLWGSTPTLVGNITVSATATTYNTSSDQRLKENIEDADDAGSKIDSIQVRKYDWKADGSHQDYGMIAQELQAVAPEAVSGDADSEEMMGVDYSKLVPMLIKEIQSLRNRVAQLEE